MSTKIVSSILLVFLFTPFSYAVDVDDNSSELQNLRTRISTMQNPVTGLPSGVSEPKGTIGYILSRMFNDDQKIPNVVLKAFDGTTRTNNNILKWSGGAGGNFAQSQLFDDGSTIGAGAPADAASLQLDVAGSVGATLYCDGNGNNCFDPSTVALDGSTVGGSGSAGYVARFTATNTLGDGVIRDNGASVGIGIAPTGDRLTVNGIAEIKGGITINGRAAISGTNTIHTARYTDDTRYGFFEVRNNSDQIGAYFGWGNGGDTVNLHADTANQFRIQGGVVGTELLNVDGGASFDTSITDTDFAVFDTDKGSVSNVIWYDYSSGKTYIGNRDGTGTQSEVTIRGQLELDEEGTAANHVVTKGYVDTAITSLSGGASIDSLSDGVSDNSSVYLGYVSGNADDGGNQNTGLGVSALRYNTSGLQNTSVGLNSMYYNNIGSYNTALGRSALQNNTSGSYNTAIGRYSQLTTTTGANNTSLGALSLDGNTTGYNNTAVGRSALGANTTGYNNVGVGMYAMDANTTGFGNVSLGYDSLGSVTSGDDNVGIGDNAGDALTTGNRNIMIGSNVSAPNPTGSDQINIGDTIFGNRANGSLITTRQGIKGNYSSTQIQGIWSIGDGYGVDTSGTNDFGTQYGMVYAHTNAGTSPSLGGKKPVTGQGHQILFTSAGVTTSMISLGTGDAMFAGDVTADNVATACVGSCSGTTPPAAGNYVVNGSLTTTGNATIGGNLSAANFYDEAPSATAYIQTGVFSSASFTAFATAGRLAYTTVVVPSGQTRQYRVSAKTMGYPTDGAGYMFVRIWCTTGGNLDYDYEYGNAVGWEGMELEGYVSLGAGTHTCYLETYGGASDAVYTATYHANSSYTNIRMWPLQG